MCPCLAESAEVRADAVKPDPSGQERARVGSAVGRAAACRAPRSSCRPGRCGPAKVPEPDLATTRPEYPLLLGSLALSRVAPVLAWVPVRFTLPLLVGPRWREPASKAALAISQAAITRHGCLPQAAEALQRGLLAVVAAAGRASA